MKTVPNKLNDAWHETLRDVRLSMKVVYTRGTEWSLTTSGSTGEVHWRMCQLGWYLVTQTVSVNHLVVNSLTHFIR